MKENDLIQTITKAGYFNTFIKAIAETGLHQTLKESGPYTVFAPTDQAFAKLQSPNLDELFKSENAKRLSGLISNHIMAGKLTAAELNRVERVKTLKGEEVRIDGRLGLRVNHAEVLIADVLASNGIVHAIDTVLVPQTQTAAAS